MRHVRIRPKGVERCVPEALRHGERHVLEAAAQFVLGIRTGLVAEIEQVEGLYRVGGTWGGIAGWLVVE